MPVTVAAAARVPLLPDEPWAGLLATIAAEVAIVDDGPRIGGLPVPVSRPAGPLRALTGALHDRYFLCPAAPLGGWWARPGRRRIRRAVVVGAHGPAPTAGPRARCYLHLGPAAGPGVLAGLAADLDAAGRPFTARLLLGTSARPDLVTVTVPRRDVHVLAGLVLRLRLRTEAAFAAPVPAFTRAIAPGVAVADEPDDGTDFGVHRCRAVAAGLLAAGPGAPAGDRLTAVRRSLTAAGIDLRAPHRAPGRQKPVG